MKHIICYSGGHSSALVAVEVVRKYGKDDVVLLNHDISELDEENGLAGEHKDIKRFKQEVADYLGLPITYANMDEYESKDQFDVAIEINAFQAQVGQALCTYNLKTLPFYNWLKANYPNGNDVVIYYGFDRDEQHRIQNRSSKLAEIGYKTDYPLAFWNRTIFNIEEIGIKRPITYSIFKHANCVGCLKAGRQHWYIVYCLYPNIFKKAMAAEKQIGYSIIKDCYLDELIPKYEEMKSKGICPNDKENPQSFWARVENTLPEQMSFMPCECALL